MSNRRVALTTWFHYHNYGTALQVVAMTKILDSLGCKADVVNYIPHGTRYSDEKATDWSSQGRVSDSERESKYDTFIKTNLSFTAPCVSKEDFANLNDIYDAFVAGSDQIWSPVVFDPRYFLDYVRDNRKKIGYAASIGVTEVKNQPIRQEMANLLSRFAGLSAREDAGGRLIGQLALKEAEPVLDPTLLLNYKEWRELIPQPKSSINGKYILCYFLGDNDLAWQHALRASDETGLPIKILPIFSKDKEYGELQFGAGPEEFFNLIDSSAMVLTDSFHGVIFSILCSKQFYAFERFHKDDPLSQNSRVYNLLSVTSTKDRLISYDEPVRKKYSSKIDFKNIHKLIVTERKKSKEYLRKKLAIDQPLVSIIVPVYNVEKYIAQCLDTILAQTYQNIEVIVVDDGTPDNASEIADQYAKMDHRIKVLHYENAGLPTARNRGYDAATGEYILFVDSDDAVAPDYVEYMVGLIENTDTSVAMSLAQYDVFHKEQTPSDKFVRVDSGEVLKNIEYDIWPEQVWNKIYKKSFLDKNKIRHIPEVLYGEGNTFNHHVLQNVEYVGVGNRRVYYYRYNPESSTRKFVWGPRIKSLETALRYRQQVVNTQDKDVKVAFGYHKWNVGMHMLKGLLSIDGNKTHPIDYRRWRRILRKNVPYVLLADKRFVSSEKKKRALRSFFFPRRTITPFIDGFEWEVAQRQAFDEIDDKDFDLLPWNISQSKDIQGNSWEVTADSLKEENTLLKAELASHLSIKRSARLLVGNIKRRIMYGKDR